VRLAPDASTSSGCSSHQAVRRCSPAPPWHAWPPGTRQRRCASGGGGRPGAGCATRGLARQRSVTSACACSHASARQWCRPAPRQAAQQVTAAHATRRGRTALLLKECQHVLLVHLLVDVGHVHRAPAQLALLGRARQELVVHRHDGGLGRQHAQRVCADHGPVHGCDGLLAAPSVSMPPGDTYVVFSPNALTGQVGQRRLGRRALCTPSSL